MDWYLKKIEELKKDRREPIISCCGDDCSICPRFLAKTDDELRETAELWFKAGWRDRVVSNKEIACTGCGSGPTCSFKILPCQKEKNVNCCKNCGDYICSNLKNLFKNSDKKEASLKKVCGDELFRPIAKSFYEKELNLEFARTATIEDSGSICYISKNELGYECDENLVRQKLGTLDKNREEVFVALYKGNVVGFVHVEKYDVLYAPTMANILGLAVSNEFRGMSYGRILIHLAEKWASKNKCTAMRVNSGITRLGAHEFYRAMGYDSEKDQKRFFKNL
ncbi:MAG: GNAT family N-acetyltransferase [Treponema sp.]|nr:GNAT family N-acetyltransferase [Candidatus Treponema equifaecale]